MLHVITYDVSNDDTRAAVAQVLLRYGERVQQSVFECTLTAAQLDEVRMRIGAILAGQGGRACASIGSALRVPPWHQVSAMSSVLTRPTGSLCFRASPLRCSAGT